MVDFKKLSAESDEEQEARIDQLIKEHEEEREKEQERLKAMLHDLEDPVGTLTEWEEGFLQSLRGRLAREWTFTERQVEVLEKIHRERMA